MAKLFRILALDGGGVRGIIPATVLAEIEQRTGQPIANLFDLIAGTSTGGLLALGLTKPLNARPQYSANDLIQLYAIEGPRIFKRSPWQSLITLGGLAEESYPADSFEDTLRDYFGEARLSQALTDVLIPTYDLQSRQPVFFKSRKAKRDSHFDFSMWQVARATTAAPTYFEPLHLNTAIGDFALADGGVVANNPAMCAYAEARKNHPEATELLIVSIGTGDSARAIRYANARDWGAAQWISPLINVFLDGMADAVHYQCLQCLPADSNGRRRYYRFQIPLGQVSDAIDDVSPTNVRALQLLANDVIRLNTALVAELCEQLIES
jgi:patatin-like phospholipase/acyl hydrolase